MHIKTLIISVLLCSGLAAAAQEKLEADRPGESRTPELVKGNHLQAETGFKKEKLSDGINLYQHPTALIRFGLFNAIELRMEMTSQTIRNNVIKERSNGLLPLEFGIKAKVLPEYKGFPSVGLLGQIGIPGSASQDYYNPRLPIEFRALFANTMNKKLKLLYNAGVKWEGDNREAQWMYSFSPVYTLSDKINLFIEEYAFLGQSSSAEHYFDGGLDYYLSGNFMLDLSAGVGLSKNASPYFIAAGVSFRIPVR